MNQVIAIYFIFSLLHTFVYLKKSGKMSRAVKKRIHKYNLNCPRFNYWKGQ